MSVIALLYQAAHLATTHQQHVNSGVYVSQLSVCVTFPLHKSTHENKRSSSDNDLIGISNKILQSQACTKHIRFYNGCGVEIDLMAAHIPKHSQLWENFNI